MTQVAQLFNAGTVRNETDRAKQALNALRQKIEVAVRDALSVQDIRCTRVWINPLTAICGKPDSSGIVAEFEQSCMYAFRGSFIKRFSGERGFFRGTVNELSVVLFELLDSADEDGEQGR